MRFIYILTALFVLCFIPTEVNAQSDAVIRQKIINNSISTYSGNCPCPYNVDRRGRSCGKRSAYSRPGGYSPLCYPKDVTEDMIKRFRKNNTY